MPALNQITPAQLMRPIGTPEVPTTLEVRTQDDVAADPCLIPTALRMAHEPTAGFDADLSNRRVEVALPVGPSRQFRDDLQQLDAGMALYDALYRWARDGFDHWHDLPLGRA